MFGANNQGNNEGNNQGFNTNIGSQDNNFSNRNQGNNPVQSTSLFPNPSSNQNEANIWRTRPQ